MTIFMILFAGNDIGDEGVKVLCAVLGQLTQLTTLDLLCLFNGCKDDHCLDPEFLFYVEHHREKISLVSDPVYACMPF